MDGRKEMEEVRGGKKRRKEGNEGWGWKKGMSEVEIKEIKEGRK